MVKLTVLYIKTYRDLMYDCFVNKYIKAILLIKVHFIFQIILVILIEKLMEMYLYNTN